MALWGYSEEFDRTSPHRAAALDEVDFMNLATEIRRLPEAPRPDIAEHNADAFIRTLESIRRLPEVVS